MPLCLESGRRDNEHSSMFIPKASSAAGFAPFPAPGVSAGGRTRDTKPGDSQSLVPFARVLRRPARAARRRSRWWMPLTNGSSITSPLVGESSARGSTATMAKSGERMMLRTGGPPGLVPAGTQRVRACPGFRKAQPAVAVVRSLVVGPGASKKIAVANRNTVSPSQHLTMWTLDPSESAAAWT